MGQAVVVDIDELTSIKNDVCSLKEMVEVLLSKLQVQVEVDSGVLSIPRFAKRVGVDERMIKKAINDGIINTLRTHSTGQVRIHPDEVERYMNSDAFQSTRRGRKTKTNQ